MKKTHLFFIVSVSVGILLGLGSSLFGMKRKHRKPYNVYNTLWGKYRNEKENFAIQGILREISRRSEIKKDFKRASSQCHFTLAQIREASRPYSKLVKSIKNNGDVKDAVANIVNQSLSLDVKLIISDIYGLTPLHLAVQLENKNAVQYLLDNYANPNVTNIKGKTPLHYAAWLGNEKIATLLLEYGADANQTDQNGFVPFNYAIHNDKINVAELLVEK